MEPWHLTALLSRYSMSLMPRAAHVLDERGREVSDIELGDALTALLNEGGEMSTDAHGCSLLQLRRQNELQHQHQQDLSRPPGPGHWLPTRMRSGAFFVPVCEHCYHEDCEGEYLACMAGRWLVAVEAVEMCDNKTPVFEVFSAIPLVFSTITVAKLVRLVSVAKLVLPPNALWGEAS